MELSAPCPFVHKKREATHHGSSRVGPHPSHSLSSSPLFFPFSYFLSCIGLHFPLTSFPSHTPYSHHFLTFSSSFPPLPCYLHSPTSLSFLPPTLAQTNLDESLRKTVRQWGLNIQTQVRYISSNCKGKEKQIYSANNNPLHKFWKLRLSSNQLQLGPRAWTSLSSCSTFVVSWIFPAGLDSSKEIQFYYFFIIFFLWDCSIMETKCN